MANDTGLSNGSDCGIEIILIPRWLFQRNLSHKCNEGMLPDVASIISILSDTEFEIQPILLNDTFTIGSVNQQGWVSAIFYSHSNIQFVTIT
jgi:hypothetical protein